MGLINGTCYLAISGTSVSCLCGQDWVEACPQLEQDFSLGLSLEPKTVPSVESRVYAFKALSSENSLGLRGDGFHGFPLKVG